MLNIVEQAWEQLSGEPNNWYARFRHYLLLGNGRSLYNAYCKSTKKPNKQVPGAWKDAAKKWDWFNRAHAWDINELEKLGRQVYEQQMDEIKNEMEDARLMREKARAILEKLPLQVQVGDGGVWQPASATEYNSARAMMAEAAKQARLALGMPTDLARTENVNINYDELSDEELDRIIKGESVSSIVRQRARAGGAREKAEAD